MPNLSDSLNYASLDQQLVHLNGVIERLQEQLLQSRLAAIPLPVYEDINRLVDGLLLARRKVNSLEEERQNLSALAQIGQVVNSSLKLDVVLQIVMDSIIRITGAERGFLMLKGEGDHMVIHIARNWEQESIDPADFALSQTLIQRVVTTGKPVLTTNALEDPRFKLQKSVIANNLLSILCVPLRVRDEIIGLIYADNRVRIGVFTVKELEILSGFANQAAVAIENARLFTSVKDTLSEVTGLKNLMDDVFTSITSAVMTLDNSGCITMCNRAAVDLFGHPVSQMIGRTLPEIAPELAPVLDEKRIYVLATEQPILSEEISQRKSPTGMQNLRFSISPLKDDLMQTQGVTLVLEDLTHIKQLEGQHRLFERMVSPAVIEQLDPERLRLGGERTEITVLFADLRDFTGFSETVPPEELVQVLNCYLAAAADAILEEGGTVDKFMGDAVLAWFNAPVSQPDHTLRALRAALGIRSAVRNLHTNMQASYRLSFGIGIDVGEAVLGLVGSEQRLDYTAIGDCVNTARLIQENAVHGQILISEDAYQLISSQVETRPVEPILVKGKRGSVPVYEVIN